MPIIVELEFILYESVLYFSPLISAVNSSFCVPVGMLLIASAKTVF